MGAAQHVGLSDDEESIVNQPTSRIPTCGACRTRESNVWWRAPKGLPTGVLCETCGTNWRKYADLNVRPLREESIPVTKSRGNDKREGTPLSAPTAKRARVGWFLYLDHFSNIEFRLRHQHIPRPHLLYRRLHNYAVWLVLRVAR